MRIVAGLILFALTLLCAQTRAELPLTPRLNQITVADGLPSNFVMGTAQDSYGYLWIATLDGLARYDGLRFQIWRKGDNLQDNSINAVIVDARNRVWIGTQDAGLAMLDVDRQKFVYFNPNTQPKIHTNSIWAVANTGDGAVWFGTMDNGLYRMRTNGTIDHYMPKNGDVRSLPGSTITKLLVDSAGRIWICTDSALAYFDGKGFVRIPAQAHHGQNVERFYVDLAGYVWMTTVSGLSVLRPDGSWTHKPKLAGGVKVSIVLWQDQQGNYWTNAGDGIGIYSKGRLTRIRLHNRLGNGLVEPQWIDATQDREGGLWFSSIDAGLWRVAPDWSSFSFLQHDNENPESIDAGYIAVVESANSNGLWIGGNSKNVEHFDANGRKMRSLDTNRYQKSLGAVTAITETKDGAVWVGFTYNLLRYQPNYEKGALWKSDDRENPVQGDSITAIVPLIDGRVWVQAQNIGLQLRDSEGRIYENILFDGNKGIQKGERVNASANGPDGALWLASSHGLLRWSNANRRFIQVPGVGTSEVIAFVYDAAAAMLWTIGKEGLRSYHWRAGHAVFAGAIGQDDGIPQLQFSGMVIDDQGVLWVSSVRGLVRIDPSTKRIRIYGVGDGLPGQNLLGAPVFVQGSRNIAINTTSSAVIFDPSKVKPSDRPMPIMIESVSVNTDQGRKQLPLGHPFSLESRDRDLQVAAHIQSLRNPAEHKYRFKLEGYDPDWVEVDASGLRTFGQLPSGDWRLSIMGKTSDGIWSAPIVLRFLVTPPWWRTPWALLGFIATFAGLAWLSARDYRERLRRRHELQLTEQKREIAEQASLAKTRFLANLGHEVRTPMTGVLGMSELLSATDLQPRQRHYVEAIRRAGEHLLRLVNDALDLARIEAGKLELDEKDFDIGQLIGDVSGLIAPLAEKRGLQFSDALDAGASRQWRGDRTRVEQILLNLLNNAIKFTETGHVALEVEPLQPNGLRFIVSDSGPGLNEEQKQRLFRRFEQADGARTAARYGGSGLGLAICQELAAAMGGKITVQSVLGEGTCFTVDLPLLASQSQPTPSAVQPMPANGQAIVKRLLLVEDDPTVAEVLVGLLRAHGHRVMHVPHGLAALAETASAQFDLALLDLDLPGIDGLALATQLRAQGFTAPLLAVTARADTAVERLVQAAGFDGFLRKPITGAMLLQKIDEIMAHSS